jgi:hypothetical protein
MRESKSKRPLTAILCLPHDVSSQNLQILAYGRERYSDVVECFGDLVCGFVVRTNSFFLGTTSNSFQISRSVLADCAGAARAYFLPCPLRASVSRDPVITLGR